MSAPRSEITIPDHEVLRKIGGGAYGEVWMARGVTGALRAVKIVWREDFEDERGFEREFEGILKFEPISRDHPGMVNILHVGRGDDEECPFYYYVMELGDDIRKGREIHPVEYEARTLRSDLKSSEGRPLEIGFCLDTGQRLADALSHLHDKDLAHRDIKPANVIFVDGKAKLADIGLVASRGQQTFVGTEGFVPPEGPGSGQADVYSLGKVLYEMATGKDRLQFPELPDELPTNTNRKQWLALNQIICNICEPKLTKRTIHTAKQLSIALDKIKRGKKVRDSNRVKQRNFLLVVLLISLVAMAFFFKPWRGPETVVIDTPSPDQDPELVTYKHEMCAVQFVTTPLRVKFFENGIKVDEGVETAFREYPPGTRLLYRFEKDGYRTKTEEFVVPDEEHWSFPVTLETFLPPVEGQEWVDSVGARYSPRVGFHESGYIRLKYFKKFLVTEPKIDPYVVDDYSEQGKTVKIVFMTEVTARQYTAWLEREAKSTGLLEEGQYVTYQLDKSLMAGPADKIEEKKLKKQFAVRCIAKNIPYAQLDLVSTPSGARVYLNGEFKGVTPMLAEKLRPEPVEIVLDLAGYKKHSQRVELSDNEKRRYPITLKQNNSVVFSTKWTNSQKADFVPLERGKMAGAWEVRVQDYQAFTQATGHRQPKNPQFKQGPNHPVVGVSKADAVKYCQWLTEKERSESRIGPRVEYRLPTDKEWSLFCGIKNEEGATPVSRYSKAQRDSSMRNMYPWGNEFPPRSVVANLSDSDAAKASGVSKDKIIPNYKDGFVNTSPVGSYPPNRLGMYDVSGNVYEWVSDEYNPDLTYDVARGGSWASFEKRNLSSWSRFPTGNEFRDNYFGFRVVLVDLDQVVEPESAVDTE